MNNELSKRERDALGLEYRWVERKKVPGEVPARNRTPQEWAPLKDLTWPPVRSRAGDAAALPRKGMQT